MSKANETMVGDIIDIVNIVDKGGEQAKLLIEYITALSECDYETVKRMERDRGMAFNEETGKMERLSYLR